MNTKPIGNLRAFTAAIVIAVTLTGIIAAGSIYPAHAVLTLTVTPNGGASYTGTATDAADQARVIKMAFFDASGNRLDQVSAASATCTSPLSVTGNAPAGTTRIQLTVTRCNGKGWAKMDFNTAGAATSAQMDMNLGPSSGTILAHEFNDETAEATAFDAGTIDLMDWPPASSFINKWTCTGPPNCASPGLVASNQASLSKFTDLGYFEIDMNNFQPPTNNLALRHAVGYLVDRQQIVNVYAGGLAVPICAATAVGQPGAKSCLQLGYPTSFGELSPTKAIQVLYEGGWRDTNNNGVLEAPGGGEPTLIFYVRQDDSIRRQAGDQVTQSLQNLPKSFTAKGGGLVTVCAASAVCKLNVDERVLPRAQISPIVFRATGYNQWNLYTGGFGIDIDPSHLNIFYDSSYAWGANPATGQVGCGGGWPLNLGSFNYICFVDSDYDRLEQPTITGATYGDVVTFAQRTQQYAWGYGDCRVVAPQGDTVGAGPTPGKICGVMPNVLMYSRQSEHVASNNDVGVGAIAGAKWRGWIGQELGSGMGEISANTISASLYNGQTGGAGYVSYRGGGVLDWGFKSQIEHLNPVFTDWLWDGLAQQQSSDACLGRNPVNLVTIVPSLCVNFGQTEISSNTGPISVGVLKFADGLYWSDGQPLTALDYKFSVEYTQAVQGTLFYLISDITKVDVLGADPATGHGGTAIVYFDTTGALLTQNAGFLTVLPQHKWCPSWPNTVVNCPFANPEDFNTAGFNFANQVAAGPYKLSSCTGANCAETISLVPNPYFDRGVGYLDVAPSVQIQPDVNRDDRVNAADLALLNSVDPSDVAFDVDFRIVPTKSATYTIDPAIGSGSFTISLSGPLITDSDRYIINRLIREGTVLGGPYGPPEAAGLIWPPAHIIQTNAWPDASKDNTIDVSDLISVYLDQFRNPHILTDTSFGLPAGRSVSINDVDYSGDISLDDLIITFVRQFTKPVGMP